MSDQIYIGFSTQPNSRMILLRTQSRSVSANQNIVQTEIAVKAIRQLGMEQERGFSFELPVQIRSKTRNTQLETCYYFSLANAVFNRDIDSRKSFSEAA